MDVQSSKHNLELAKEFESVSAFVGIHPELFLKSDASRISSEELDEMCKEIKSLAAKSSGIGEIGLDAKYGSMDRQHLLLERQLEIAESNEKLALTLHTRGTISETLEMLSRYRIKNSVLLHWFSGTEQELKRVNSLGYYASFGLPVLYSSRIAKLVLSADQEFLLGETDSPIAFESVSKEEPLTPFAVTSVIFAMSSIRNVSFDEMTSICESNANMYLKRKTH